MESDSTIQKSANGEHPKAIKVLIYHRVLQDPDDSRKHEYMCVYASDFRKHLRLLERWGFTSITFHDYHLYLKGELDLPRKPVIITFDDGYKDVFENAYPLLQKFGMKAVIFAIANSKILSNVWDHGSEHPASDLMTEHELLELHSAGHEIGSHSLSHPALPSISKEQLWEELSRSRMLLEILLNAPVRSVAYPYGLVNEEIKKIASEAGYFTGCGVYTGPAAFGEDPFEIRRILIRGTIGTFGFALRMLTPYEYYGWLRWKLRMIILGPVRHQHEVSADVLDTPESSNVSS